MLGPKATPGNFTPDELTPEWEFYEDGDGKKGTADAHPESIEPTPEAIDDYVNVNIMIPCGSEMSRERVTGCKRDIGGNTAKRASENPILDMLEYTVQFKDGEVTELTANVIAESMYAQCEPDGIQYVLLDDIIGFVKPTLHSLLEIKYCCKIKIISASLDCWMENILPMQRRIDILVKS